MDSSFRLVLADEHIILREGLARLLSERTDLQIVGQASNGVELINVAREVKPDLVITAISLPCLRGIEAISELRALRRKTRFIVLTRHSDEEYLETAIAAGADGYILKQDSPAELFAAIDAVLAGRTYISPRFFENVQNDWIAMRRGAKNGAEPEILTLREREIVKMIAEGNSSKEIASLLFVSPRTIDQHRRNIMGKLNLKNAAALARFAVQRRLLALSYAVIFSEETLLPFVDDLFLLLT